MSGDWYELDGTSLRVHAAITRAHIRSSQVYPAAGYAYTVQEAGGKVAVFNLDKSEGDEEADYLFRGPCEELLPKALGQA